MPPAHRLGEASRPLIIAEGREFLMGTPELCGVLQAGPVGFSPEPFSSALLHPPSPLQPLTSSQTKQLDFLSLASDSAEYQLPEGESILGFLGRTRYVVGKSWVHGQTLERWMCKGSFSSS